MTIFYILLSAITILSTIVALSLYCKYLKLKHNYIELTILFTDYKTEADRALESAEKVIDLYLADLNKEKH
ncbi:hypothetical protein [Providencia phage PSTCR5]|uniref:Uncharacterized protein n=1 Tax=Providencia phage PSTCR5 TaxID=2783547 RepID=A0A873WS78_9CAUD|nr:hypothetical protein KNV68_gp090 [Providencia phage PSTCR5]QPB12188.1 hypothetical protein [Providencia phage PSTCR5]